MRVLQLIKTSVGATWALAQMRALRTLGVEVHAILPDVGPMAQRFESANIPIQFLNLSLQAFKALGPVQLRKSLHVLVDSIKPDIIHSHFIQTTLASRVLLGRSHKIPRVYQVAGPLHLENPITRTIDVWSAGKRDYWVAACEMTQKLLRRAQVPESKILLAYHGLDPDKFPARPKGTLRKELGLPPDVPIAGMVAFMYRPKRYLGYSRGIKGHEDLIDALSLLPPPFDQTLGVFIGDAWDAGARAYEKEIRHYASRKLGVRAIFMGRRSDVLDLYPDFDVAVHPSHSENLGGAVESMMMNVPTIATAIGGFPDIVVPNKTGWLVPPRDPHALAATLVQLLSNRAQAEMIAQAGRVFVSDKLDIHRQTKSLISFYERVLKTV